VNPGSRPDPAAEADRRRRRAASQEVLDRLAEPYRGHPAAGRSRMFGSEALTVHGKIVAFVDGVGALVLKLPADRAAELVSAGDAVPIRVGRSPAKEWVGVPVPDGDADPHPWADLLADAFDYVEALSGS
jgi:hypothetical protein